MTYYNDEGLIQAASSLLTNPSAKKEDYKIMLHAILDRLKTYRKDVLLSRKLVEAIREIVAEENNVYDPQDGRDNSRNS
jgi:hypothetical protein